MEIGVPDVAAFLQKKDGRSLINYGTTASHAAARALAFGQPIQDPSIIPPSGPVTNQPASPAQIQAIEDRLRQELDAGGLGVGMGIQYTPGATRFEVIQTFRVAASRHVPVFTHVRSFGLIEPGSSIEAISEVIGAAAISGASLHIVHINSSCISVALECISMVAGARARGLDITTEAYPYIAGMTAINSALFNPGWKEKLGVDYNALQLPDTGERLTKERFDVLHAEPGNRAVLLFMNTQEMVDAVIAEPLVMIASDGEDGHPRNAGTFSRILARYVRERGSVTLMDAIRKMALMPAQRLEKSTVTARRKGRLQEGADADIVVFDPKIVADRSTYAAPREPSVGMKYVLVGGTVLIDQAKLVPNTFPGKPLLPNQPGK
jgi:N-acyl-D-aspartate/D-glutamate deacylase